MCRTKSNVVACQTCNAPVSQTAGKGRARLYCSECLRKRYLVGKRQMTCSVCGKTWTKEGPGRAFKYCSSRCRYIADKPKRRKEVTCQRCNMQFVSHSGSARLCHECWHWRPKSGTLVPCESCGKECYRTPGNPRRFCSNECRVAGQMIGGEVREIRTGNKCLWCDSDVVRFRRRGKNGKWTSPTTSAAKDTRKYCSKKCASLHRCNGSKDGFVAKVLVSLFSDLIASVIRVFPDCIVCGNLVEGRKGSKTCSVACQVEQGRRNTRERYEREYGVKLTPVDADRQCIHCGVLMPREQRNGRGRILCHSCCYVLKRGDPHKMRAIRYGVEYQGIDRQEVFERDGWRCQLCYCKVNRKALRSKATGRLHPRNAHLDHIVPFAAGGAHTIDNVQCSCLRCNVRKGKRKIGQLRIF